MGRRVPELLIGLVAIAGALAVAVPVTASIVMNGIRDVKSKGNRIVVTGHCASFASICSFAGPLMRAFVVPVAVALLLAVPAGAAEWTPSATWLAQARCIHLKEGPWTANTGNGYYGGFQFAAQTWKRVGGKLDPAFKHPGDRAYPFHASSSEQLYRAWLLWKHDGGTWRSWGGVGASCS